MHGANAHYGHRACLHEYTGFAPGTEAPGWPPIPGLLQHGWNHDLGAPAVDIRIPLPEPFFTWSERNLRNCRRAGLHHAIGIGAPFLYLPPAEPVTPEPGSLIAIPIHGWEQEKVLQDFNAYAEGLAAIASQFKRVTVCLYFWDHQFEANRRPFLDRGMEVVTVGHRDGNPRFLHDQRQLLLRHEFATSNRVQTGLFYAMYLGLKSFIHGEPIGVEARIDHSGHLWDAWQAREFPQLQQMQWRNFQGDVFHDVAAQELGAPLQRQPDALRELFLWQPDQRAELERRARAFRIRTSQGFRRAWHRVNRTWTAAHAVPPRTLAGLA